MKEADALNNVSEFHHTFKHPVLNEPNIPEKTRCELRVSLIQEELDELKKAIEDKDIVEITDALCDLQYVLSGAVLEFGLAEKFAELFSEVHRSNMSKACTSEEEANETLAHYNQNHDIEGHVEVSDGKFLVYRNGDKKTLKSINYSPADLKKILNV